MTERVKYDITDTSQCTVYEYLFIITDNEELLHERDWLRTEVQDIDRKIKEVESTLNDIPSDIFEHTMDVENRLDRFYKKEKEVIDILKDKPEIIFNWWIAELRRKNNFDMSMPIEDVISKANINEIIRLGDAHTALDYVTYLRLHTIFANASGNKNTPVIDTGELFPIQGQEDRQYKSLVGNEYKQGINIAIAAEDLSNLSTKKGMEKAKKIMDDIYKEISVKNTDTALEVLRKRRLFRDLVYHKCIYNLYVKDTIKIGYMNKETIAAYLFLSSVAISLWTSNKIPINLETNSVDVYNTFQMLCLTSDMILNWRRLDYNGRLKKLKDITQEGNLVLLTPDTVIGSSLIYANNTDINCRQNTLDSDSFLLTQIATNNTNKADTVVVESLSREKASYALNRGKIDLATVAEKMSILDKIGCNSNDVMNIVKGLFETTRMFIKADEVYDLLHSYSKNYLPIKYDTSLKVLETADFESTSATKQNGTSEFKPKSLNWEPKADFIEFNKKLKGSHMTMNYIK